MKVSIAALIILIACLPAALMAQDNDGPIRVGARTDAPPFIWQDPDSGHFLGFFWDICTMALARAKKEQVVVPISAAQRTELLNKGRFKCAPGNKCAETGGALQTVDLLCDPTTINLARMRDFAQGKGEVSSFVFSPIIYLAIGSYFQQKYTRLEFWENVKDELIQSKECKDHLDPDLASVFCIDPVPPSGLEWLIPPNARKKQDQQPVKWSDSCAAIISAFEKKSTTSPPKSDTNDPWDLPQLWPEPIPEKPQFEIWGYVSGATIENDITAAAKRATNTVGVCPQAFVSHEEAAKAFCTGRIFRYFGDIDLVRAAVEAYRTSKIEKCLADETQSNQGTYEPYAMVLSNVKPGFPEAFNLALYSMFTDGTVALLFDGRFGKDRRSQYLDTLFRINGIPSGIPLQ